MNKNLQILCPVFNEIENVENFYLRFSNLFASNPENYGINFLFMDVFYLKLIFHKDLFMM